MRGAAALASAAALAAPAAAAEQEAPRAALPAARSEAVVGLGHDLIRAEPEAAGRPIPGFLAD